MKLLKCSLVLLVLFYFGNDTARAQQCIGKATTIAFANGVNTTPKDAEASKKKIKQLIKSQLMSNDVEEMNSDPACADIKYSLQPNPSDGLLLDLFESLQQDFITDTARFWLILSGLDIMPDFFRDKLLEIAAAVDEAALVNPVTQGFVNEYNLSLSGEDVKLIAVSHSQGNLFSNTIHANLNGTAKSNFKIVSVANPDSDVADNGPYTTLTTDASYWRFGYSKVRYHLFPYHNPRTPRTLPSASFRGTNFERHTCNRDRKVKFESLITFSI